MFCWFCTANHLSRNSFFAKNSNQQNFAQHSSLFVFFFFFFFFHLFSVEQNMFHEGHFLTLKHSLHRTICYHGRIARPGGWKIYEKEWDLRTPSEESILLMHLSSKNNFKARHSRNVQFENLAPHEHAWKDVSHAEHGTSRLRTEVEQDAWHEV